MTECSVSRLYYEPHTSTQTTPTNTAHSMNKQRCPATTPPVLDPSAPLAAPPEGPDSDPIRIRAARELIKKIQIVTLNDDLGFYRPANWVNPTEKPTPP